MSFSVIRMGSSSVSSKGILDIKIPDNYEEDVKTQLGEYITKLSIDKRIQSKRLFTQEGNISGSMQMIGEGIQCF